MRFTREAEATLAACAWPGNVRELEHAVERAIVMAPEDVITPDLLGIAPAPAAALDGAGATHAKGLLPDESGAGARRRTKHAQAQREAVEQRAAPRLLAARAA